MTLGQQLSRKLNDELTAEQATRLQMKRLLGSKKQRAARKMKARAVRILHEIQSV